MASAPVPSLVLAHFVILISTLYFHSYSFTVNCSYNHFNFFLLMSVKNLWTFNSWFTVSCSFSYYTKEIQLYLVFILFYILGYFKLWICCKSFLVICFIHIYCSYYCHTPNLSCIPFPFGSHKFIFYESVSVLLLQSLLIRFKLYVLAYLNDLQSFLKNVLEYSWFKVLCFNSFMYLPILLWFFPFL